MTHRLRSAFGRFLVFSAGFAIALALVSSPLAAQQTSGKIEGTVTDQASVPIANAQVFVVGTSFGAVTNDKGYYFINNVPVGTYTIRAQFIGYAPSEVRGIRVQGGQTATVDVKMQSSAVVLTGVTVTAAANPIVPRDQVASKSIISGDLVGDLPIDDVRNIIAVQPGVVESGAGAGVSIRGGRPGEANVYIDGAPVRAQNSGSQRVNLGTNAVEEASVTTGALGVEFADAQSGVISFTTKAGGPSYAGSISGETDAPFGDAISVGYNRFEANFGGPVPKVANLTFFLSSVMQGQLSDFRGYGQDKNPTYVMGGLDTTVTLGSGASIAIPQFVQYSGECPGGSDPANAARNAILSNYGVECQGRRFPMDWTSNQTVQGKLQYTYGAGSRVALSGLASGQQGRNTPFAAIGDPASFTGFHNWSRYLVLDATHTFVRGAERALSLNLNFSRQQDNQIVGPLDPSYEAGSRSPAMGMEFGSIQFAGLDNFPSPIGEDIIRNIRTNSGTRVPLLNREDLRNSQPHRVNPYGLISGGWRTTGFDVGATLYQETRYTGRGFLDFQANRFNRFQFGGDFVKTNLSYWSSALLRQAFMDAYVVDPLKYGLFASDRLDLGDVVLDLGVRYDYYNSNALFAKTPGRIYTNPRYQSNYVTAPTDPAVYAAFLADTSIFSPSVGHTALSPRLRVSFPVTENTGFRLSYSHQVQTPEFTTLLTGVNNDLDFTNTNDVFGRDLQFGKSILFEFGVRHAFSQDMVLDVSAYNKDKVSDYAARILPFADPLNTGDTINVNVLTNSDFGNVRGVDVKLDRRVGSYLNASVAYTFQLAKGTGSDPFSYLRTLSRQISQVTGSRVPPPQAILPTDDNRTHNIAGSVGLTLPGDWRRGTTAGRILSDFSAFATFRFVSGLPYTRQTNQGSGTLAPRQGFGLIGTQQEPMNASTMPWNKNIDLRLNKGFKLGGTDLTVYADVRNLLNFKNVTSLFVETGDVVNAEHRTQTLSSEFANLAGEASSNNALGAGNAIDLSGCSSWADPVNCISLSRAEARFGNGDGTYTLAEQTTALNAYYDSFNGPQWLYGAPRHIRLGIELNF
jgi:hypothetical protein